ncbi:MAG: hypothetical protein MI919_05065, partial [Holophagales bacterium]|nr:hypothetical protein [Holophagales bacterium]
VDGWREVLGGIHSFRQSEEIGHLPVIFTEMGFTYRRGSTLEPWSDTGFSVIYEPTLLADGTEGDPKKHVIVWREEPEDFRERALAVGALHQAHRELEDPFLQGILYWKLSSHDYHYDDESFMVWIGEGTDEPILPELRAFLRP